MRYVLIALAVAALGLAAASAAPFMLQTSPPTPVCASAPPPRLIVRERARVSSADPRPLNIRDGAGMSHPVIALIPSRGVFYVLDGPKCAQNYFWYRVEYKGIDGWIAEGDSNAYFVEVYPPGW